MAKCEIPVPQKGLDETYDTATEAVDAIKSELEEYLQTFVQLYKDRRVVFSHAKFRYEIEVPEEHVKKDKPSQLELTSQRQGYQRFSSFKQRELVDKLEVAEEA